MSNNTQAINPGSYEADRRNRRQDKRVQRQRGQTLGEQRADVEAAISADLEAKRLEALAREFDEPGSELPAGIRAARQARIVRWITVLAYLFIAIVDFWLATPDVAEILANKAMPMVAGPVALVSEALGTTPVWLRCGIGALLTTAFLMITAGVKWIANPHTQEEAIGQLEAGDDEGFHGLRRVIWAKRCLKGVYLVALAYLLFGYLYPFDVERAKMMEEVRQMGRESLEWRDLGITILGGELVTDEAVVPVAGAGPGAVSSSETQAMAGPAAVVFSVLWILHALLIIAPVTKGHVDRELASFKRSEVGEKAGRLREREGQLHRGILHRIHESDPSLRDALIREAQPVAARINAAAGYEAMEVPAAPEDRLASNPEPAQPIASQGEAEPGNGPAGGAHGDHYQEIFGRPGSEASQGAEQARI